MTQEKKFEKKDKEKDKNKKILDRNKEKKDLTPKKVRQWYNSRNCYIIDPTLQCLNQKTRKQGLSHIISVETSWRQAATEIGRVRR